MISALWVGEPSSPRCRAGLENAQSHGLAVICAPVFCELHASPGATAEMIGNFLRETGIHCDFAISEDMWREAALRFARYATRRRKSGGESPKRMLVDFSVGAHALRGADCLFTLDRDRYARDFPELRLI